MKYVTTYRAVADLLPSAQPNDPGRSARVDEFAGHGELLTVGTFDGDGRLPGGGRGARRRHPFRPYGVVAEWPVRRWKEILQT
jgi:hypothetical protein